VRFFTGLITVVLVAASTITAQEPPKVSPAQQEVINAHTARIQAVEKRDYATYARLVADDCINSDDDGILDTNPKAHLLERWKLPLAYDHGVNARDYVVHVYGSTAVLNYRVTVHEQFTDADIISEQRYTETYIKHHGSWLLIAKQWGNLPVNFRKPVAVDTSVYKDYVGQYQWRPVADIETISLRDGKLWSRFSKDKEDDEYLPLSSDTFFVKDDIGSMQFVRDGQGHVTGYTYHRWDGQEIHVMRIK
jgi:ketosteroid isomerase-like protein